MYDFDQKLDRSKLHTMKWEYEQGRKRNPDLLCFGTAEMDFQAAPPILKAFQQVVDNGHFGYPYKREDYYQAVIGYFKRHCQFEIKKEWIANSVAIYPSFQSLIEGLSDPGDEVIFQTPVHFIFADIVRSLKRVPVENPLKETDGTYKMDFEDLKRKITPKTKLFLLCNPHNPVGRVWTREELTRVGEICLRHGVTVVSDEIHGELAFPGHVYLPFASLSDEFLRCSVTCISPSKAFNIAGLQIANIVCADEAMRRKIDKAININEVCDVNPFGVIATIAAYNEGEEWLNQLLDYLHGNYICMRFFCREHLPDFPITRLEGTYLVWMDCRALGIPSEVLEQRLIDDAELWLNAGTMYGAEGEGFMRWNIACPRARLIEGLRRFVSFAHPTDYNVK